MRKANKSRSAKHAPGCMAITTRTRSQAYARAPALEGEKYKHQLRFEARFMQQHRDSLMKLTAGIASCRPNSSQPIRDCGGIQECNDANRLKRDVPEEEHADSRLHVARRSESHFSGSLFVLYQTRSDIPFIRPSIPGGPVRGLVNETRVLYSI